METSEQVAREFWNRNFTVGGNLGEQKRARDQYFNIRRIFENQDDGIGLHLLDSLVESATGYIGRVVDTRAQTNGITSKLTHSQSIDWMHDRYLKEEESQNELEIQVRAVNEYLMNNHPEDSPTGGIYSGNIGSLDPVKRFDFSSKQEFSDWAGYLVLGLFLEGKDKINH